MEKVKLTVVSFDYRDAAGMFAIGMELGKRGYTNLVSGSIGYDNILIYSTDMLDLDDDTAEIVKGLAYGCDIDDVGTEDYWVSGVDDIVVDTVRDIEYHYSRYEELI